MRQTSDDDEPAVYAYTVYHNPRDYPGKWVVRPFRIDLGPEPLAVPVPLAVANTLEEARNAIPRGLVALARNPEDHPCVVETWI